MPAILEQSGLVSNAVNMLQHAAGSNYGKRNLAMSGDPHYQPRALKSCLGYDQRVGWQMIVEWFWMLTLAEQRIIPAKEAALLDNALLQAMLEKITTTDVTRLERGGVGHDILALMALMKRILPRALHRWLHFGITSYDTICTAYALQARETFVRVLHPKACELDELWRGRIKETARAVQIGRTHLQDAIPVTIGCWLAVYSPGSVYDILAAFPA